MITGKGAMVWRLRDWQGGDPKKQADEALLLGLSWVSLKILDGDREKWENVPNDNRTLLPATVGALRDAGIEVLGWGWMYGRKVLWDFDRKFYGQCTPTKEAQAAVRVCRKYGMRHFQANAETYYKEHGDYAAEWCTIANHDGPEIEYSLCSYRFPEVHTTFPFRVFAPHMDAWCPQIYWLLDNRDNGGSIQLLESQRQHDKIRRLPFVGIAPTYPHKYKVNGQDRTWYASGIQILSFIATAKAAGHPAAGMWNLEQATAGQKDAFRHFDWNGTNVPPPTLEQKVERLWRDHYGT